MKQWDYIIVGAGSSGCVLANRLSADPSKGVLLIEAGTSDRNPLQRIPMVGVLLNYGHPARDWGYQTQPDPSRHDRVEVNPRGKLLGGTSSVNGMIYVRGAKEDFDGWAELGNPGWSYDEVVPLYRGLEDHEWSRTPGEHREHYGHAGGLKVRQIKGAHRLSRVFVSACTELGIPENPHYNTGTQEGACILSATHSGRVRYSSSQAFLQPIKHRRNLHVLTHSLVTRVLIKDKRAVGVCVAQNGKREATEYQAGQIILSGGVFNSPQLLMLSGIGPGRHLQEKGICVELDLPGVGQNLQDHPNCPILAKVNVHTFSTRPTVAIKAAIDWLLFGRGLLTSAGCQALAFVKTRTELPQPDVQIHIMPLGFTVNEKKKVRFLDSCITLLPNISHPFSRGEVKLNSRRSDDSPKIYPNMLEDERDIKTLMAAATLCRALLQTPSFRPYVEQETSPGRDVQTHQQWEHFIRENASSGAHQCGTCKMGIDRLAVVDPRLRVHGIEGLRVIDASIMPRVPSGNTNASCMMIAEKGAQMILQDAKPMSRVGRPGERLKEQSEAL